MKEEVKVEEAPPSRDPFIVEVEALANFGKFDQSVVKFCKDLYQVKDRKLMGIYSAYLRTFDRDDFIHTINRFY
jgi:hypothetical protein